MRGNASHWKIVEDTRVKRVVRNAAQSIGNMNAGVVEVEDLFQEGLLIVAGTPKIAEHAVAGDAGMLYKEVRERLYKAFVRPLDRSGELDARKYKTITPEDAEASESAASYVTFDDGSGDYNADAVRLLLPAVWDESYAYSLPEPDNAPEQGMPRAAANKSTRNSHWAYIADIKTGWERLPSPAMSDAQSSCASGSPGLRVTLHSTSGSTSQRSAAASTPPSARLSPASMARRFPRRNRTYV